MSLFHIFILSVVQAITEFLPISSSGHLILLHSLFGEGDAWGDSLIMDLAVHVGTLAAVVVYFRRDICQMAAGLLRFAAGRLTAPEDIQAKNMALFIIAGSVPALIAGLILTLIEPAWLRSIHVVTFNTLVFGVLLWWVDARQPQERTLESMTLKDAIWIGLAQMLALIPGTSRSGITMTCARWLGFSRTQAARYSFLLSIVATSAAGAIGALKLIDSGDMALAQDAAIAAVITFFTALLVIAGLLKFLQRYSFKVFGIYRLALGVVLIALIYAGVLA